MLLALAAALAATPSAVAQDAVFGQGGTLTTGHVILHVDAQPPVLYAGDRAEFAFEAAHTDGTRAPGLQIHVSFRLGGGQEASLDAQPTAGPPAGWSAAYVFPRAGQWTLHMTLVDGNETDEAEGTVLVFPDLSLGVIPRVDTYANLSETRLLRFAVLQMQGHPPAPNVTDVEARVAYRPSLHRPDQWNASVALTRTANGEWAFPWTFNKTGVFRVWLASRSGGFADREMPSVDFVVRAPPHTYTAGSDASQPPLASQGPCTGCPATSSPAQRSPDVAPAALGAGLLGLALAGRRGLGPGR